MHEEVPDERDVHLLNRQLGWSLAGLFARELKQQPERVAIRGNRVWTRRHLSAEPVGEELLDKSWEGCCRHGCTSSTRLEASSSSSGTASMYQ